MTPTTDIIAIAQSRYSTKAFDPEKKIPQADIDALKEVMRLSPSSVNSQPWHFLITSSEAGKTRIGKAMQGNFAMNLPKVQNASHVIVFAAKTEVSDDYIEALLAKEEADGRFAPNPNFKEIQRTTRATYTELHRTTFNDLPQWTQNQCFLNLGALLFAAGAIGVDAVPMEGFDKELIDAEFSLTERGYRAFVIVALGYRAADDFNAALPKSRLNGSEIFEEV